MISNIRRLACSTAIASSLLAAAMVLSACSLRQPVALAPTATAVSATPISGGDVRGADAQSTAGPLIPTVVPSMQVAQPLTTTTPIASTDSLSKSSDAITKTIPAPTPLPPAPGAEGLSGEPPGLRGRLGVGVPLDVTSFEFDAEMAQLLGMGWYLDWRVQSDPVQVDGLEFAQMVRVRPTTYFPGRAEIAAALAAQPGSLWLIGNEPDVQWQDKTPPEAYAARYHELYVFIKTLDPSAQVAIGGVSQVTPLRLSYLERVLAAYQEQFGQPMPVDVWNIHAFILREERDSWGVSIPPGFDDVQQGMLWEIEDHDDLDLLRQQVVDFRRWMLRHDQQDKPLIVTEYGILMPQEYGFAPEAVADYMRRSFDLLLYAHDPEIGYPADDNRLVQRLVWYSLSDTTYPTSNLVDPTSGELTLLGKAFAEYANGLGETP